MKKLTTQGDIKVHKDNNKTIGSMIPPSEMKAVLQLVNESAYTLYTAYRTWVYKESNDITDEAIAVSLGWTERRVQDNRRILEKAELLLIERIGTKAKGFTQVYVGADTVSLLLAGLPPSITEPKLLAKIRKNLKLTYEDLGANLHLINKELQDFPEKYED